MLEDVKTFTNILVKWKITPNQFYLCWLLYWDHKEFIGKKRRDPTDPHTFANAYRYATKVANWKEWEIEDLLKKELVVSTNPKKRLVVDTLEVTQKFIDGVLVNRKREDEFWDGYPSWIDNFDHPSKPQINLKVCGEEEAKKLYRSRVRSKKKHERVMEVLNWAKRHDKIRWNIKNFIKAKMWEQLEELMIKEGGTDDSKFGTKTVF